MKNLMMSVFLMTGLIQGAHAQDIESVDCRLTGTFHDEYELREKYNIDRQYFAGEVGSKKFFFRKEVKDGQVHYRYGEDGKVFFLPKFDLTEEAGAFKFTKKDDIYPRFYLIEPIPGVNVIVTTRTVCGGSYSHECSSEKAIYVCDKKLGQ